MANAYGRYCNRISGIADALATGSGSVSQRPRLRRPRRTRRRQPGRPQPPDGQQAAARTRRLSHRPTPANEEQTLITTGIEDAIAAAREAAGDKDVALMGGGVVTETLKAGLVDELVLHQVPILLGGGLPFFRSLPDHQSEISLSS